MDGCLRYGVLQQRSPWLATTRATATYHVGVVHVVHLVTVVTNDTWAAESAAPMSRQCAGTWLATGAATATPQRTSATATTTAIIREAMMGEHRRIHTGR